MSLKLLDLNVLWGGRHLDRIIDFVKKEDFDILTFQEMAGGILSQNRYDSFDEIKKEVGDEKFFKIRRYWNEPIKYGETLKDVYERAVPFIKDTVLPQLKENKNILISTHGNNLRAIIKFLENIPDDKVCNLETATGEVYVYDIDENGKIISKEIRAENSKKGKQ